MADIFLSHFYFQALWSTILFHITITIHIKLPSFSSQFLSRVIIFHCHCHTSPFSVLTAPPHRPGKLPTKDQPSWPSFLYIWVLFPYYVFLNTLQMSPIILSVPLPLTHLTLHDIFHIHTYIIEFCDFTFFLTTA